MRVTLALTGAQHAAIHAHLFPGDGREAVALMLCGRAVSPGRTKLVVHEIVPVPHEACQRTDRRVTWPTSYLEPLLDKAARRGMAVAKIHSHPGGNLHFSEVDDEADAALFGSVHAWVDDGAPHLSAVMVPSGAVLARAHRADGTHGELHHVCVVGDDIRFWRPPADADREIPEFARRHAQAFGRGTFQAVRGLRLGVVGCSGTGSPLVDQVARLGVGEIVLVDPDKVEEKNLNRIVNTTRGDIGRPKVEVLAGFAERLGLGSRVEAFAHDLSHPAALHAISTCDVVFGCMDGVEGRDLLNRLATFYGLAYFDVGVMLDADGHGGIGQICGSVHYLQPGRSSLRGRGLYTDGMLEAESLRRQDPAAYEDRLARGYIRGVPEDRPAVGALNGLFSSLAVMEFLLRLHPSRLDPNGGFATQTFSLTAGYWENLPDEGVDEALARYVGRGDMVPFLNRPALDMLARAA